jgi:hypothetical protein
MRYYHTGRHRVEANSKMKSERGEQKASIIANEESLWLWTELKRMKF